jgi:hypothetical protein
MSIVVCYNRLWNLFCFGYIFHSFTERSNDLTTLALLVVITFSIDCQFTLFCNEPLPNLSSRMLRMSDLGKLECWNRFLIPIEPARLLIARKPLNWRSLICIKLCLKKCIQKRSSSGVLAHYHQVKIRDSSPFPLWSTRNKRIITKKIIY